MTNAALIVAAAILAGAVAGLWMATVVALGVGVL